MRSGVHFGSKYHSYVSREVASHNVLLPGSRSFLSLVFHYRCTSRSSTNMRWLRRGACPNPSGPRRGCSPAKNTPCIYPSRVGSIWVLLTALLLVVPIDAGMGVHDIDTASEFSEGSSGFDMTDDDCGVTFDFQDANERFQTKTDHTNEHAPETIAADATPQKTEDLLNEEDSEDERYQVCIRNTANGLMYKPHTPFGSLRNDDCTCVCKKDDPDPDCIKYVFYPRLVDMCKALQLQPNYPIYCATIGGFLEYVMPWDSQDDCGEGHERRTYGKEEDFKSPEHDVFSWHDSLGTIFKLPLHKNGPFVFDVSGTDMNVADEVDKCETDEAELNSSTRPGPLLEVHPLDDDGEDEVEDLTGDHNPYHDDYTGRGDVEDESNHGYAIPSSDSDSDAVQGNGSQNHEETEPDEFEDPHHEDVFNYLKFNIIPVFYRGKPMALKRKQFKQNAKRRYILRYCLATKETELYHHRNDKNTCKKRKEDRGIRSTVRAKFYNIRRVPRKQQSLDIVQDDHNRYHDGHNGAEGRLGQMFKIDHLRDKINAVDGNNCPVCATHQPLKAKPIQPILTSRRGQLVMFDLTQFYVPVRLHAYVVNVHDEYTYAITFKL